MHKFARVPFIYLGNSNCLSRLPQFMLQLIIVLITCSQIGGELMDFIIVLHDSKAVKTFCSRMHFSLGAGCSAAAGPVGRVLEADLRAGDRGSGMCYTYSCSKGIAS